MEWGGTGESCLYKFGPGNTLISCFWLYMVWTSKPQMSNLWPGRDDINNSAIHKDKGYSASSLRGLQGQFKPPAPQLKHGISVWTWRKNKDMSSWGSFLSTREFEELKCWAPHSRLLREILTENISLHLKGTPHQFTDGSSAFYELSA